MKTYSVKLSDQEVLVVKTSEYVESGEISIQGLEDGLMGQYEQGLFEAFTSLALALACAGLDLRDYESALQTSWEAIWQ